MNPFQSQMRDTVQSWIELYEFDAHWELKKITITADRINYEMAIWPAEYGTDSELNAD